MPPTRVVNVHTASCDTYVGRPSCWGNPFIVGRDGSRAEVVARYAQWIQTQPHLLARLGELRGRRLGCHCFPLLCHAQVLAHLADTTTPPTPPGAATTGGPPMNQPQPPPGLRTIIAGSRDLQGVPLVATAVRQSGFAVGTVISGGARGIDQAGAQWARRHQLPVVEMPAQWERDGKSAGYRRNERMAAQADAVIVIVAGAGDQATSPGSAHMIALAQQRRLPLFVYHPGPPSAPSLPVVDHARVSRAVAWAVRVGARYNELHTAYWHAVSAATAAGTDPPQDAAVQAARQALHQARPVLRQIHANTRTLTQAAGWDWPAQRTAPSPMRNAECGTRNPDGVISHSALRTPHSRRRLIPALVVLDPHDPPTLQAAKQRLNTEITAATRLGKSGSWAPLRNARTALERLLSTPAGPAP